MVVPSSRSQDVDDGSEASKCTCKQVSTDDEGQLAPDLVDNDGHEDQGGDRTNDTVDTLDEE
jgi:hypothetical protein